MKKNRFILSLLPVVTIAMFCIGFSAWVVGGDISKKTNSNVEVGNLESSAAKNDYFFYDSEDNTYKSDFQFKNNSNGKFLDCYIPIYVNETVANYKETNFEKISYFSNAPIFEKPFIPYDLAAYEMVEDKSKSILNLQLKNQIKILLPSYKITVWNDDGKGNKRELKVLAEDGSYAFHIYKGDNNIRFSFESNGQPDTNININTKVDAYQHFDANFVSGEKNYYCKNDIFHPCFLIPDIIHYEGNRTSGQFHLTFQTDPIIYSIFNVSTPKFTLKPKPGDYSVKKDDGNGNFEVVGMSWKDTDTYQNATLSSKLTLRNDITYEPSHVIISRIHNEKEPNSHFSFEISNFTNKFVSMTNNDGGELSAITGEIMYFDKNGLIFPNYYKKSGVVLNATYTGDSTNTISNNGSLSFDFKLNNLFLNNLIKCTLVKNKFEAESGYLIFLKINIKVNKLTYRTTADLFNSFINGSENIKKITDENGKIFDISMKTTFTQGDFN